MARLRAILVGVSHWHVPLYLDALEQNFEVVAVSDRELERARSVAARFGVEAFADISGALSVSGVDLAFVFGRHDEMHAAGERLVARGIPFVIEKPAGLSLAELVDLTAKADAASLPVTVPLVHRWGPISEALSSLPGPRYLSVSYIVGPPDRYRASGSGWMLDPAASGGGALANLGVHYVDLFLAITGSHSARVRASTQKSLHGLAVEDHATLLLDTVEGCSAVIEVGYAFPVAEQKRSARFSLAAETGFMVVDADGRATTTLTDGSVSERWIDSDSDTLFPAFVDRVAASFESGFAGLPTLRELVVSMSIIDEAYRLTTSSAKTGATWAS